MSAVPGMAIISTMVVVIAPARVSRCGGQGSEDKSDGDREPCLNVALKATVRTTPAVLVTAGVMVAAIVLLITVLVRA